MLSTSVSPERRRGGEGEAARRRGGEAEREEEEERKEREEREQCLRPRVSQLLVSTVLQMCTATEVRPAGLRQGPGSRGLGGMAMAAQKAMDAVGHCHAPRDDPGMRGRGPGPCPQHHRPCRDHHSRCVALRPTKSIIPENTAWPWSQRRSWTSTFVMRPQTIFKTCHNPCRRDFMCPSDEPGGLQGTCR